MKKRFIAFIPLAFACIVMLLYIVVPHHHHEGMLCFTAVHCVQENTTSTCEHEHNQNSCDRECEIQSLFELDSSRQHQVNCHCGSHFTPDVLFIPPFLLTGLNLNTQTHPISREFFAPFQERLHPVFVNSTLAGRAPPVMA